MNVSLLVEYRSGPRTPELRTVGRSAIIFRYAVLHVRDLPAAGPGRPCPVLLLRRRRSGLAAQPLGSAPPRSPFRHEAPAIAPTPRTALPAGRRVHYAALLLRAFRSGETVQEITRSGHRPSTPNHGRIKRRPDRYGGAGRAGTLVPPHIVGGSDTPGTSGLCPAPGMLQPEDAREHA